jgi:aspartyl/asparaginyl-tRNA synthetase
MALTSLQNSIGYVDPFDYNNIYDKLYSFFRTKKGYTQYMNNISILSACEDPKSVVYSQFGPTHISQECTCGDNFNGCVPVEHKSKIGIPLRWCLPQTSQMNLEVLLMSYPQTNGFFSVGHSFRDEKQPKLGRHQRVFPLLDFETHGQFDDLVKLECDLLLHLGFDKMHEVDYTKACEKYGVDEITHEEEERLWHDFGNVVFLKHFPTEHAFFNMKRENNKAQKIDVIICGQETIGSAVRENDVETMRKLFQTTSGGDYANELFQMFGRNRVEKELEEFLGLKFIPRIGGGIGITRLIRSMKMLGLL